MMSNQALAGPQPPGGLRETAVHPGDMMELLYRSLKTVDTRLAEHQRQVAFILLSMAEIHGGIAPAKMRELCLLAYLHDFGICLVPGEADAIFQKESEVPDRHALYGHLLCKELLPGRLSEVLRYHHTPYCELVKSTQPEIALYAQMMQLADRVAVLVSHHGRNAAEVDTFLAACGPDVFGRDVVRLFHLADLAGDLCYKVKTELYLLEQKDWEFLLEPGEAEGCLRMLAFVCDMREGRLPVGAAVREAAVRELAAAGGLAEEAQNRLGSAALLLHLEALAGRSQGSRWELLEGLVEEDLLLLLEGVSPVWGERSFSPPPAKREAVREAGFLVVANQLGRLCEAGDRLWHSGGGQALQALEKERREGRLDRETLDLYTAHLPQVMQACRRAFEDAMARYGRIKEGAGACAGAG